MEGQSGMENQLKTEQLTANIPFRCFHSSYFYMFQSGSMLLQSPADVGKATWEETDAHLAQVR